MLASLTFCRFLEELEGLSLTNQDTVIFLIYLLTYGIATFVHLYSRYHYNLP